MIWTEYVSIAVLNWEVTTIPEMFSFYDQTMNVPFFINVVLKMLICFETTSGYCFTRLICILFYLLHVITSSPWRSTCLTVYQRSRRTSDPSNKFIVVYVGLPQPVSWRHSFTTLWHTLEFPDLRIVVMKYRFNLNSIYKGSPKRNRTYLI